MTVEIPRDRTRRKVRIIRGTIGGLTTVAAALTLSRSTPLVEFRADSFSTQPGHSETFHGDFRSWRNADVAVSTPHGAKVARISPQALGLRRVEANRYANQAVARTERQSSGGRAAGERRGVGQVRYGSSVAAGERLPRANQAETEIVRSTPIAPEQTAIQSARLRTGAVVSPWIALPALVDVAAFGVSTVTRGVGRATGWSALEKASRNVQLGAELGALCIGASACFAAPSAEVASPAPGEIVTLSPELNSGWNTDTLARSLQTSIGENMFIVTNPVPDTGGRVASVSARVSGDATCLSKEGGSTVLASLTLKGPSTAQPVTMYACTVPVEGKVSTGEQQNLNVKVMVIRGADGTTHPFLISPLEGREMSRYVAELWPMISGTLPDGTIVQAFQRSAEVQLEGEIAVDGRISSISLLGFEGVPSFRVDMPAQPTKEAPENTPSLPAYLMGSILPVAEQLKQFAVVENTVQVTEVAPPGGKEAEQPATPTPVPTATATSTEIPASPTATEAGPKEGKTMVENGYTYTYTVIPESGYKGWFRPMADMPLVPWLAKYVPDGSGGYVESTNRNNIGPTRLLVEKGVEGEQAIKALTQRQLERGVTFPYYVEQIYTWIRTRYEEINPNADDYKRNTDLQNGNISFKFHAGPKEYTWTISPHSGATIYVVKNDPAHLTEENGFWTWVDGPYGTHFSTAFWGVDQNGIVGAISLDKSLDQLDPFELRIIPLYHQVAVLKHDDVQGVGFDGPLQMIVTFAGRENPLVIEIENRPVIPTPTLTP